MIIDAHVHIEDADKPTKIFGRYKASLNNLLEELKVSKIQKVVLLPIAPFISNDFIGRVCKENPEKFIGFASVDIHSRNAIKQFEEEVVKYGLKGLKIHPRLQRIILRDEKIVKLVKKAAGLNLPILIDCFPQVADYFPVEETFPERIGELAQKVPEAKIIMAHAGGYKLWDAFFIARCHSNIYLDFSLSPDYFRGSSLENDLVFVLKKIGARRCIHGSDYPDVSLDKAFSNGMQLVSKAGLSLEEQEYFFGKTLLSILSEKDGKK